MFSQENGNVRLVPPQHRLYPPTPERIPFDHNVILDEDVLRRSHHGEGRGSYGEVPSAQDRQNWVSYRGAAHL